MRYKGNCDQLSGLNEIEGKWSVNIFTQSRIRVMVFNATFNNISVMSSWSVLLVEETGIPRENHSHAANHIRTLYYIMLYRVHLAWTGFELTTLVVKGSDYAGCHNFNYHTITTWSGWPPSFLNQCL
jgi:hypothetical protein